MAALRYPFFRLRLHTAKVRKALLSSLLACCTGVISNPGFAQASLADVLSFGVLPLGGARESRTDWEPLLNQMGSALGRPVLPLSVTSYEGLQLALQENRVEIAFLSGKLAVDAVTEYGMEVLAQVTRPDGLPGYRAVLIARKNGPIRNLDDVLRLPGQWSLGRGQKPSMSGYMVPVLQLFGPANIQIEKHFKRELVAGHQSTALAVANGEVDVATNNTADLQRFAARFPLEASRLQTIWQSDLIPHGVVVMRKAHPAALREKAKAFLMAYGRGEGYKADQERNVLKQLHGLAGFLPADSGMLLPMLQLEYQLAQHQALSGNWVTEAARQARLDRLASEFEGQKKKLHLGSHTP